MSNQRFSDFLVGLLVIATFLVIVLAFVFTQGWNKSQFDLYMRAGSALDLNVDTKVTLQYLPIGEVKAVAPQVDSATGHVAFVVHLKIDAEYQDGTPLHLPLGTTADILPGSLVGGAVISLHLPERNVGQMAPGDTITSIRRSSGLDAIAETADSLQRQVALVLTDTRSLISNLSRTVTLARGEVEKTGPDLRATLNQMSGVLAQLRPTLARADTLMGSVNGTIGGLQDSISGTLSQTRSLLQHLDSLAMTASAIAGENREVVRTTAENLYVISAKLEHFLDQVSRRPLRMITGVTMIPVDSLRARSRAADSLRALDSAGVHP
ncbi:MAG: MlaD family protein [Gemmatimonadota bacterium]